MLGVARRNVPRKPRHQRFRTASCNQAGRCGKCARNSLMTHNTGTTTNEPGSSSTSAYAHHLTRSGGDDARKWVYMGIS